MDKNDDIVLAEKETNYDLDDLILFGVGEPIRLLNNLLGSKKIKIGSMEVDIPTEDPNVSFEDRLDEIFGFAGYLLENSNCRFDEIVKKLLKLDGWHWSKHSFRTPLWMFDHRELLVEEAIKIKGLEWLIGST
jgi:hypothetical protein